MDSYGKNDNDCSSNDNYSSTLATDEEEDNPKIVIEVVENYGLLDSVFEEDIRACDDEDNCDNEVIVTPSHDEGAVIEVDEQTNTSQLLQNGRPRRKIKKPTKYGAESYDSPLKLEKLEKTEIDVEDSFVEPCTMCESVGEDETTWIQCSFCAKWCHGPCVQLQFTQESARGIVRFKCPVCRLDSDATSDSDEEIGDEKDELIRKIDKLSLLLDQEKEEVENLKQKEKEEIHKSQAQRTEHSVLVLKLNDEIDQLKRQKKQDLNVLENKMTMQTQTLDARERKISELKKVIEDYKNSGVNEEDLQALKASLEKKDGLHNTVLHKLGLCEKELKAAKEREK